MAIPVVFPIPLDWKRIIEESIEIFGKYAPVIFDLFKKDTKDQEFYSIFDVFRIEERSKPIRLKKPLKGMLAPLSLGEGNINDIEKDWPKVIADYKHNFNNDRYLLPRCSNTIWKMWGPSYEHYLNNDSYEIFQFGYGDENNSLPVLISKEQILNCDFLENLVIPLSTDGVIVPFKNIEITKVLGKNVIDKLSSKFSKLLVVGNELNSNLFGIDKTNDPVFYQINRKDFYSAYIWVRLDIEELGDFYVFEHGNIANPTLLNEYIDLLSVKIKHLYSKYENKNIKIKECFLKRIEEPIMQSLGL